MHFTSETSSNGVIERNFVLDEISGVLWSPKVVIVRVGRFTTVPTAAGRHKHGQRFGFTGSRI